MPPDEPLLLVTHVGPDSSHTSLDRSSPEGPVYSGSATLDQAVKDPRVIGLIHGHTHEGVGLAMLSQRQVINPGSLRDGRFAVLTLQKRKDWMIQSVSFHNLNHYL